MLDKISMYRIVVEIIAVTLSKFPMKPYLQKNCIYPISISCRMYSYLINIWYFFTKVKKKIKNRKSRISNLTRMALKLTILLKNRNIKRTEETISWELMSKTTLWNYQFFFGEEKTFHPNFSYVRCYLQDT